MILYFILAVLLFLLFMGAFCVFFDQAIFSRKNTIYKGKSDKKQIVLTFDDGPSPEWTPKVLEELRKCGIKATFFMVGHHVQMYPEVAKMVANEGHEIANHGYAHSVTFYYTPAEIEEEIKYTEHVIREITGYTTKYFRPPKAWMRDYIKKKVKSMGYETVLWSLNSKDWVSFNHKIIVRYLEKSVKNGDIILFHDSGNVFSREGGSRNQTVKSVSLLVNRLKAKGYEFVTIEELLNG